MNNVKYETMNKFELVRELLIENEKLIDIRGDFSSCSFAFERGIENPKNSKVDFEYKIERIQRSKEVVEEIRNNIKEISLRLISI